MTEKAAINELIQRLLAEQQESTGMTRSAYEVALADCRKATSKADAITRLRRLAKQFNKMTVAKVFADAAMQLEELS